MVPTAIEELAIFTGHPAFDEPLHVGRPNIGDRERLLERISAMLDSRWLSNRGPYLREFEARLTALLGVKHCIAACNGTVALEILARATGLKDEVIVPSFTFVATAHALQWQEITPVFCDIDPLTHTLDPAQVERLITPRTTGIIGVHLWGRPCAVEALQEIADRHGLTLLFDAAHALGCSHRGTMIGNFGRAEMLSFHATKFVNSFEGGAIVTNDDELAAAVRLMTNFGFSGYDNVIHLGTNGKMSEAAAAMGLTNLESMDDFVAANRTNYDAYRAGLEGVPGLRLMRYDETEAGNYQYVVAEIDAETTGLARDNLVDILHAEQILARRYFYPGCHRMEPYRTLYPDAGDHLQQTERVAGRVIVMPTGGAVSPAEIGQVCRIMRLALDHGREITARLRSRPASVSCGGD